MSYKYITIGFSFPFGYSIIYNIRNQLALIGTPSTSTKWAGEPPHKHLTLFKLPFTCLHHCTTLQHHTARPSRTATSRTMTSPWTPAMAQTAAANSPAPFQQMVKLRTDTIRQGLLYHLQPLMDHTPTSPMVTALPVRSSTSPTRDSSRTSTIGSPSIALNHQPPRKSSTAPYSATSTMTPPTI